MCVRPKEYVVVLIHAAPSTEPVPRPGLIDFLSTTARRERAAGLFSKRPSEQRPNKCLPTGDARRKLPHPDPACQPPFAGTPRPFAEMAEPLGRSCVRA